MCAVACVQAPSSRVSSYRPFFRRPDRQNGGYPNCTPGAPILPSPFLFWYLYCLPTGDHSPAYCRYILHHGSSGVCKNKNPPIPIGLVPMATPTGLGAGRASYLLLVSHSATLTATQVNMRTVVATACSGRNTQSQVPRTNPRDGRQVVERNLHKIRWVPRSRELPKKNFGAVGCPSSRRSPPTRKAFIRSYRNLQTPR